MLLHLLVIVFIPPGKMASHSHESWFIIAPSQISKPLFWEWLAYFPYGVGREVSNFLNFQGFLTTGAKKSVWSDCTCWKTKWMADARISASTPGPSHAARVLGIQASWINSPDWMRILRPCMYIWLNTRNWMRFIRNQQQKSLAAMSPLNTHTHTHPWRLWVQVTWNILGCL